MVVHVGKHGESACLLFVQTIESLLEKLAQQEVEFEESPSRTPPAQTVQIVMMQVRRPVRLRDGPSVP